MRKGKRGRRRTGFSANTANFCSRAVSHLLSKRAKVDSTLEGHLDVRQKGRRSGLLNDEALERLAAYLSRMNSENRNTSFRSIELGD